MSLFRGDRVLSHFLRHDPFSPFTRPSLTPFYSPFFTVFDEPRTHLYDHPPQQSLPQSSSPHQASSKASSPSSSTKADSHSQEVTRTDRDQSQVERRPHRRHQQGRHPREEHPLSLWGGSPFTGSAFPSLFNAAMTPFAASVQAVPDITVDVHSTPQAYAIHAAVPGMEKNDIKVTVDDGVLTIEAERRATRGRQPVTSASSTTVNGGTSASTASPSAASSTPSTAGAQPAAEMKAEESKEEKADNAAQLADDGVSSTAATTSSSSGASAMEEDPEDFHYTETYYGRVERSIQLPEDARVDELTAKYENGVLKIDIPRVQEQKPKGRRVEIQ